MGMCPRDDTYYFIQISTSPFLKAPFDRWSQSDSDLSAAIQLAEQMGELDKPPRPLLKRVRSSPQLRGATEPSLGESVTGESIVIIQNTRLTAKTLPKASMLSGKLGSQ